MDNEEKPQLGRPRLYSDPAVFAEKTRDYFEDIEAKGKMPTMAGLCLHLGFYDRESFARYAEYGDDFSRTVKAARLMIEDDRHQRLANPACTGVIFDLKVNHGWQDKTVSELTGPNGGPVETVSWTAQADEDLLKRVASLKGGV